MLPKKQRFGHFNINEFLKRASRRENDFFSVWFAPNTIDCSRFAAAPPKTNFKKATERNKIKRRVYNAIKINIDRIKKGDYFIRPKTAAAKATNQELADKILKLFW